MQLTVPHFAVFYIQFGITYSNIVVFILFSSFSAKTLFALSFFLYFSFSSIFFVRSKGYWNCQTACRERFYIGKMDSKTKIFLSLFTVFSTLIANVFICSLSITNNMRISFNLLRKLTSPSIYLWRISLMFAYGLTMWKNMQLQSAFLNQMRSKEYLWCFFMQKQWYSMCCHAHCLNNAEEKNPSTSMKVN